MRRILCLIALAGVAGCATGPSLQSRMAAYTGVSGEKLVQDLGVPDKQISLNGVQYMAYVQQRQAVDPSPDIFQGYAFSGPFYAPYNVGFWQPDLPANITVWRCETTFKLHDDKVVSFSLRGNACS